MLTTTGPNAVVEWLLLELRDPGDPASILQTRPALVQRDGDVVALDGSSNPTFSLPSASYYIAVRHRNHFGCMTASPVSMSSALTSIDFTLGTTATWGTDARETIGGIRALWAGDTKRDGALKYTGAANDRDPILVNIGGVVPTNIRVEQIP